MISPILSCGILINTMMANPDSQFNVNLGILAMLKPLFYELKQREDCQK